MPELAMAASLVEPPVALVLGTILPNLLSVAMLHVSEPLPGVGGSVLEVHRSSLLELRLVDVRHVLAEVLVQVLVLPRLACKTAF